jgi:two-component system, NtrC family, C4-dicarboxylate transport sensor histidine kinase DctB
LKIQFDELVDEWRKTKTHVFVTDANGVVELADQPAWQFRTLLPLSASTADALRKSLQYGDAELKSLPFVLEQSADGIGLVDVTDVGDDTGTQTYLSAAMPVHGTSWVLHILTPVGPGIRREIVSASLLAGLLGLGVATAAFLLWYRQELVRSRALEQLRMRGELERRVRERTVDLTESYERLQIEIAERERVEAVLRQAQEKLVHAEKLAALGQMAAGISHEVSQPLAAIRSYADNAVVLHDRGRLGEVKENLSSIAALTERISQFMQHLKLFARKASGKVEPVSMKRALEGSLALVMHRFRAEDIEVIQELSKEDLMVWGEQVRIEQVLVNLLQNAADAMRGLSHPRVRISIGREDGFVVLTVADNGVGISPVDLPKLFSAFFTTKNEAKGLGLGLYISRGIVEEFGGALCVASETPGATFELRLRAVGKSSLAELPRTEHSV